MPSEVDRLIEAGLTQYGSGDLDGALAVWEQALALDPENPQAQSYVDYVRANYALLKSGAELDDGLAPFGIEEEPEYHIEVSPGELVAAEAAPIQLDPHDEGWGMDDEPISIGPMLRAIELEADEPPAGGMGFDDATREFVPGGPPAISIALATDDIGMFTREESTQGFSSQPTDVKKRDLGFVQASELKVTLRTPSGGMAPLKRPEPAEPEAEAPPKPAPAPAEAAPAPAAPDGAPKKKKTRDMPSGGIEPLRRPAEAPSAKPAAPAPRAAAAAASIGEALLELGDAAADQPETTSSSAITKDVPMMRGATRDLSTLPPRPPASPSQPPASRATPFAVGTPISAELAADAQAAAEQLELTSAPTRDLGMRPLDGETAAPAPAARAPAPSTVEMPTEGTRYDIVLPFDPIDARSAQILDEVDADAPANEAKEDRVRRRITRLIERAAAWNTAGEYDKAVTAADLAMSEDPNSALAQKLLQRHRDAIQGVFQNFLGDLQRQPQLARPLHELATAPISPRAAFLLSRIDGTLSVDEILDVSGMPRVEAYRHLCQLFLRNILR